MSGFHRIIRYIYIRSLIFILNEVKKKTNDKSVKEFTFKHSNFYRYLLKGKERI